jgi:hypothetical protein
VILLGVPILFIVPFPIPDVLIAILLLSPFFVEVVLCPILLIQFLEALTAEHMLPCLALLSVMIVPLQEVFVISVVFKSLPHPFLLITVMFLHSSITWATTVLPVFPVLIGFLILEISSRRISEYKLIILCTLFYISDNRIGLCYTFEHILKYWI